MQSTAVLHVELSDKDSARVSFTTGYGTPTESILGAGNLASARESAQRLAALNAGDGVEGPALVAREFSAHAVPDAVARHIRAWTVSQSELSVLCVQAVGDDLAALPWELLPQGLGLPGLMVARVAAGARPASAAFDPHTGPIGMVVAGWSQLYGTMLPGIERELSALHEALDPARVSLTISPEPTFEKLAETFTVLRPQVVHLIPPGFSKESGEPALAMTDADGATELVPVSQFVDALAEGEVRLVVLNSCNSGLSAARLISEGLGATVFGWSGWVDDALAADFALFFYRRLLEGSTPMGALRAFTQRDATETSPGRSTRPILWFPTVEDVDLSVFPTSEVERAPIDRSRASGDPVREAPLEIQIQFHPVPALNPALIKNGRPAIERLTLLSSHEIPNARLRIECDTGNSSSVVRQTLKLANGEHPVSTEGMHFPVLYELTRNGIDRRHVNFVVTASVDDVVVAETTRAVLWMGPKEWMDQRDTWAYIPAFVQPENRGVLEILDEAVKTLKTVGSPTDAFDGYQRADPSSLRRQVKAVFQTLRDDPFRLNYINPPSSPVLVPGSTLPMGQRVRFPDEITSHKRATCHDLVLLFASCAEHFKVHGLVIIVPGHTFFGYWLSEKEHHDFWTKREHVRVPNVGASWMINRVDVLQTLLETGAVEFVEATMVTDRNASFEEACEEGAGLVRDRPPHAFDAAVDVSASRHAVQPV